MNADASSGMTAAPATQADKPRAGCRALHTLVVVNIIVAVASSVGLVVYLSRLPSVSPTPTTSAAGASLVTALAILAIAGALGGSLCNLRGISGNLQDEGFFPQQDILPYYLRLFTGAVNGLVTFFLGSFIVAALAKPEAAAWSNLQGLLPFVGIALLAGFAVQEFLQKLKVVALSLFSSKPLPKE